ncbi:MAG TPA: GGDEF domain-containing protein [Solirubrobacteraceae bacterium]|nr:GGDEF domain-containing protein [Solirubrobacteraceae bacterium]
MVISLGALTALASAMIVRHPGAPISFYVLTVVSLLTGIGCVLMPWGGISARWLHVVPVVATVEVALGVRLAGVYGDIAANYYIFVVVFIGYAFSTRRAIAAHVAFAVAASSLALLYVSLDAAETAARTLIRVLVLLVIAGIVTLLREGLQKRQRELELLAVRDPLTGVGNYRLLSERLEYEILRHRRSGATLTVMLLDLDGFKEINDTYGHPTGDRVLHEVAAALASTVRAQDTLARQGGDEFSILAPDTTDAQAEHLAVRVREAVRMATRDSLTTSIGWVTYPSEAEDPEILLALADANLRYAKRRLGADRSERTPSAHGRISGLG